MKTKLIIISALILFIANHSIAQSCGEFFLDTGGEMNPYGMVENYTTTLCPNIPETQVVELTFFEFDVHCSDTMEIYDGPTISSNSYGQFCGSGPSSGPSRITATNISGCLTIRFVSINAFVGTGWRASIVCKDNTSDRAINYDIVDETIEVKACNKIEATNVISGTSQVSASANNEISLLPGFEVAAGASFSAFISDCNSALTEINPIQKREILANENELKTFNGPLVNVFPNPSRNAATISFSLSHPSIVNLQIYNLNGQLITTLLSKESFDVGNHQLQWRTEDLLRGMYFLYLNDGRTAITNKIILK